MADLKISQLNSIVTVVPATDVLPVVQGGTTYKMTPNQILGSGGVATLASATITGDLTVDTSTLKVDSTNNRVGINTASPVDALHVVGSARLGSTNFIGIGADASGSYVESTVGTHVLRFNTTGSERYRLDSTGIATWSNVGGVAGTAMTLNSTGLGIGASPSYKLDVVGPVMRLINSAATADIFITDSGTTNGNVRLRGESNALKFITGGGVSATIDSSGNVGIGVTPSAWDSGYKVIDINTVSSYSGTATGTDIWHNARVTGASPYYKTTAAASFYRQSAGVNYWFNAPSGTAGNTITFTQAMTLDASGNLLVGTTSNTNASRIFSRGTATSSALALQGASGDVALAQLTVGKFDNNSTTSQVFVRFTINDNSGGSGQINANGASQAAFGSFSDSRLKENIVNLPSQLASVLSLRPVEFDYKDGSGHQIGFVAQEIQKVYSDTVGEQDGFLTVTGWSKTEARLVSAIKELAAKVQALESKLA